MDRQNSINMLS